MKILKLNSISKVADKFFENYEYSDSVVNPDGIMLRSFKMHDYETGSNLVGVARAGAGVNNIPIPAMSDKGIVVFNTPGANANAVKELVVAGLLLGSRKIYEGITWAQGLDKSEDVAKLVEKGKSQFVGAEITGKTLGILGLGAIGAKVANVSLALGMEVCGYDPYLSVPGAMRLDSRVEYLKTLDEVYAKADYVTIHMPYTPDTKHIINKDAISKMRDGVVIINCARGELVNNDDIKEALATGKVSRYVTDFPSADLLGVDGIVTIPHLGASTPEAEDNCAVMAGKQLTDLLENGNIVNSVNFPMVVAGVKTANRITVAYKVDALTMLDLTSAIESDGACVKAMATGTRGDLGYAIIDICKPLSADAIAKIAEKALKVRVL